MTRTTDHTPAYFAGFDPGSRQIGWCVLSADDGVIVDLNVWRLPPGQDINAVRLPALWRLWQQWPYRGQVVAAALETQWVGKNAQSALTIGRSRGWLEAWLVADGVTALSAVSPAEGKLALSGRTDTDKAGMVKVASHLTGLDHIIPSQRHNAADALGIALAGIAAWRAAHWLKQAS